MKLRIVLILLLVFQFSFAQETDKYIINVDESDINDDWENWEDKVPISGNVRVGLMVNQVTVSNFKPLGFYVSLPKIEKQINLCIEFSSKDGRYSGKLCFPIESRDRGVYKINIPTKYKDKLSAFTTEEVVILASLNSNIFAKPEAYVLSSWTDFTEKEIKSIDVYLNSIMPTKIVLSLEKNDSVNNKINVVNCESLIPPTLAYNKKCHIVKLDNLKNKSYINITQRRKRGSTVKIVNYKIPLRF